MVTKVNGLLRKAWPVLAAGVLIQANGCAIDLNATVQGLVATIVTNFITSLVFSILNLPPPVI